MYKIYELAIKILLFFNKYDVYNVFATFVDSQFRGT